MNLQVAPSAARLAGFAAARIASVIETTQGQVVVALAGGSTPRATYEQLGQMTLPWERIVWFTGDERMVPHDDPQSNIGMIAGTLGKEHTSRLHAYAVQTHLAPQAAAEAYERLLEPYLHPPRQALFDLVILGLGADGHTASLFPGSAVLEQKGLVRPTENGRVTLTYTALNSSRHTLFLVSGAEKRDALKRLLAGDRTIPAGRIQGHDVTVIADEAAAG